ncbi:hypothetical protein CBLAS_1210 [Campylobacter blaseri]|uniref:Glycine zipper 2TM domain-containing protein n=1 Tax=Campylobacter blaseri TaxID=2042961 RepID=A0A2P8QZV3_9BACT|nr:glycine zipper 2TM domain-containing protein [Campylobacter blaseri]PSM51781.1 hypothetical protein CQ405_06540 [Campylobacter blaseri]PSM53572.1 hypothetical protein CRN67_06545 [Campylobacter blaseri]QKF86382.1 hypothetical protein CBLAS_1210 [Campylobacter blaseri]
MRKILFLTMILTSAIFARSIVIDVVEHRPVYEIKEKTHMVENCNKSDYNIAGTVLGGVAGGVLGHQIGGGTGKKLATVAGTVLGGYAGNKAEGNIRNKQGCTYKEEVSEDKVLTGYRNIGYYNGKEYSKITLEKQEKIRIDVK